MTDPASSVPNLPTRTSLHTRSGLAADLAAIGVAPGMTLIVHSALSRIGTVVSGAQAVIQALMDRLGPQGTLVMPTFSGDLTDPATWRAPPVPPAWHDTIRASTLPFDPARTPSRNMGAIPEQFRTWPDVRRSNHPVLSLAAWGRHAEMLMADHQLAWALGDDTPMGRFYACDGHVLLVGVGHDRNSSLHLAETRAAHRRTELRRMPVARQGEVLWEDHPDVAGDWGVLFPRVGAAFEATGAVTIGRIGDAEARLMSQRALVDFATPWLDRALADSDA
jgi:aminoglycoside 3-N-acetyltransferase